MLKRSNSITAFVILVYLFSPLPMALAQEKAAPQAPPAPAQSAPRPASAVNPITEAAVKSGVLACTSRINQVSNFLLDGSQGGGATMFTPPRRSRPASLFRLDGGSGDERSFRLCQRQLRAQPGERLRGDV